jgi:hypothetical protein
MFKTHDYYYILHFGIYCISMVRERYLHLFRILDDGSGSTSVFNWTM